MQKRILLLTLITLIIGNMTFAMANGTTQIIADTSNEETPNMSGGDTTPPEITIPTFADYGYYWRCLIDVNDAESNIQLPGAGGAEDHDVYLTIGGERKQGWIWAQEWALSGIIPGSTMNDFYSSYFVSGDLTHLRIMINIPEPVYGEVRVEATFSDIEGNEGTTDQTFMTNIDNVPPAIELINFSDLGYQWEGIVDAIDGYSDVILPNGYDDAFLTIGGTRKNAMEWAMEWAYGGVFPGSTIEDFFRSEYVSGNTKHARITIHIPEPIYGEIRIEMTISDVEGNEESLDETRFTQEPPDTTPPTITGISVDGDIVEEGEAYVKVTDAEPITIRVEAEDPSGIDNIIGTENYLPVAWTEISEGVWDLAVPVNFPLEELPLLLSYEIWVYDGAGNMATEYLEVEIIDAVSIETLIEDLIEKIADSPEDCWRHPAQNRKMAMTNKLIEIKNLVINGELEEAYDKLLHDIKPKLTGLKTDEREEAWNGGKFTGIFKNPWVLCEDTQEKLRQDCNDLLTALAEGEIPEPNNAPVAVIVAESDTAVVGEPIIFDGTPSYDADGDALTYEWDFGDGSVGNGAIVEYAYSIAGTYIVTLTVTDDDPDNPLSDTTAITIEILEPNIAPIADFVMTPDPTQQTVFVGQAITFDAALSYDIDGFIVSYEWDFGDPLNPDTAAEGQIVEYAYLAEGAYVVTLTVVDNNGAESTYIVSFYIYGGGIIS